jgi:hypothetical protein
VAGIEGDLASYVSAEETLRLTDLLDRRRSNLTSLLAEWERVSEAVESQ